MRVIKYLIYVKSFIILRHKVFDIFVKSTIYWDNPRIFNNFKGHHTLFFISKCSRDIMILICGGLHNFLYKICLYKKVCNVIRFRRCQNNKIHVQGNDIQDALSPSTAKFD